MLPSLALFSFWGRGEDGVADNPDIETNDESVVLTVYVLQLGGVFGKWRIVRMGPLVFAFSVLPG